MSSNTNGLTNEQIAKMWEKAMSQSSPVYQAGHVTYPSTSSGGVLIGSTGIASGHTHTVSYPPSPWANIDAEAVTRFTFDSMIRMRLGLTPGCILPFQFIQGYKSAPDRWYVFVVQGGEALILEDGELFPSDQLITQLRLIAK